MTSIKAKDLNGWADKRQSHGDLPILIRRLINSTTGGVSKIDFPGGDSIGLSGKDGVVVVDEEKGNAWVPGGESCWEVSCEETCNAKANDDYKKRTKQINPDDRAKMSFVFATPRNWKGKRTEEGRRAKEKWEKDRQKRDGWKNVRVLDAVDLEQWIETSTSVYTWLTGKLGHASSFVGVFTPEEQWEKWASVTSPELSFALILTDREDAVENLTKWLETSPNNLFRVIADSRDEAVAFVCAALEAHTEHYDRLLVISPSYDEASKLLNAGSAPQPIFLFSNESEAAHALRRKAHVIIATAKGGRHEEQNNAGLLRRISRESFVKAIMEMGLEEKRAEELNLASGRSVSILRRRLADTNIDIAKPAWTKSENMRAMIAAALTGKWDGNCEYDQKFISDLAGMSYENLELLMGEFLNMDDAPIEKIGDIWMVKSRIDALLGVADFIFPSTIAPFWEKTDRLLRIRNPEIDLPEEERYLAEIHGKTPPYSGELFSSVIDTLILLVVYQGQITGCNNIKARVEATIRGVLRDAGADRWYSIHALLPKLAEAAPDAFMSALEDDLQKSTPEVSALFSEQSSHIFPRFNHAGLLWALEILAWDKRFLPRVIDALAQMNFSLSQNYGNSPSNTLLSFFRAWLPPRCGVESDERIEQFNRLCQKYPHVAWSLSLSILMTHDSATPNALPRWSGVPEFANRRQVTRGEHWKMRNAAFEAMMRLISGDQKRIATILDMFESFDREQTRKIIQAIEIWKEGASETACSEIAEKIIKNIYLCRLRTKGKNDERYADLIQFFEGLYKKTSPNNPVLKHKWLFANSWVNLPDYPKVEGVQEERQRRRMSAIQDIYEVAQTAGIFQLAADCGTPGLVGLAMADVFAKDNEARLQWASDAIKSDMELGRKRAFMSGIFSSVTEWRKFASLGFKRAIEDKWDDDSVLMFSLALYPCVDVWDEIKATCPSHIYSKYWQSSLRPCDEKDMPRYVAEMTKAGRYGVALEWAAVYDFQGVDANAVVNILDSILKLSTDQQAAIFSNSPISSYEIGMAMSHIIRENTIPEKKKIGLEIAYFNFFPHSEYRPITIFKHLAKNPSFFMETVCRLHKRKDGKPDVYSQDGEKNQAMSKRCLQILNNWNIPPGCIDEGLFNESQFVEWMTETRKQAGDLDRVKITDQTIGEILIHLPKGGDNWPFPESALCWLEDNGTKDIFTGMSRAIYNSRGVVMRLPEDGGRQERDLAKEYRRIADMLRPQFPHVATVYDSLFDSYESDAKRQDEWSKLHDRD